MTASQALQFVKRCREGSVFDLQTMAFELLDLVHRERMEMVDDLHKRLRGEPNSP